MIAFGSIVLRLFRKHAGASIQQWVRAARMHEAARLLASTGMRVSDVSREVGFPDALYFSRVFSKTFGTPPLDFARRHSRP